jgi:hypothetical protein
VAEWLAKRHDNPSVRALLPVGRAHTEDDRRLFFELTDYDAST